MIWEAVNMRRARRAKAVMWYLMVPGVLLEILFLLLGKQNIVLLLIGGGLMMGGLIIWAVFWRCPDCGKHLGRATVEYCPYCGKSLR